MEIIEALLLGSLLGGGLTGLAMKNKVLPAQSQNLNADLLTSLLDVEPYQMIELDLSTARTNEAIGKQGLFIFIDTVLPPSVPVYLAINDPQSAPIDITRQRKIILPFNKVYVTNAAGTGKLIIYMTKYPALFSFESRDSVISDLTGIYNQPEWAAKNGLDKNLRAYGVDVSYGGSAVLNYTVTAGKILTISSLCNYNYAANAADGDLNQFCVFILVIDGVNILIYGSNGGGNVPLTKPIIVNGGSVILAYAQNRANHLTNCGLYIGGYEA